MIIVSNFLYLKQIMTKKSNIMKIMTSGSHEIKTFHGFVLYFLKSKVLPRSIFSKLSKVFKVFKVCWQPQGKYLHYTKRVLEIFHKI